MFPRKMARTHQQMFVTSILVGKQTKEQPYNRRLSTISKVEISGIQEAQNLPSLTSKQAVSLKDQLVQQEKSISHASMKKNKVTSGWRTPTSQRTGNKPMTMRTRRTNENPMAVGAQ